MGNAAQLDELAIKTIRGLSMDAVQAANSGHPGTPMALAPLGWALFPSSDVHDPTHPGWPDRDRFVLSCGHASMLQYSLLHLTGYPLTLDDIRQFRQWGSLTPGHPENFVTPGVETTTGPLGQGIGNGVGMAMAERHLARALQPARARPLRSSNLGHRSDGDIMEGVASEAASIAGHLQLGKLTVFWDDNRDHDRRPDRAFVQRGRPRLEVRRIRLAHGERRRRRGHRERSRPPSEVAMNDPRPSFIRVRTIIGRPSPNKQDTSPPTARRSAKTRSSPPSK